MFEGAHCRLECFRNGRWPTCLLIGMHIDNLAADQQAVLPIDSHQKGHAGIAEARDPQMNIQQIIEQRWCLVVE